MKRGFFTPKIEKKTMNHKPGSVEKLPFGIFHRRHLS